MSGVATDLHDPAGVATPAPPPGICVAGHFREGPRYRVRRPQGSRDWLLTHTVAGAGRYALGAAGWRAEPGDLCLLLPGAEHDYGTDGEHWEFWWAHFIPRPHWAPWLRWPALERGALRLRLAEARPRPRLRRAWERLVADARGADSIGQDLALVGLEEVILLAAAAQPLGDGRPAAEPRVRETLDYLAGHLAERHTLAEAAARVSLSPSRLGHLVKAETGQSLGEALGALRLREAARLLQFTERSVGEVASDVGFASAFHFSRRFAARYGVPPREYRRRLRSRPGR